MPDRKLTDRQKHFIAAYTDKSAKTYANATQSYMESHPGVQTNTAAVEGHRTLHTPKIRESIDEILEETQAGYNHE